MRGLTPANQMAQTGEVPSDRAIVCAPHMIPTMDSMQRSLTRKTPAWILLCVIMMMSSISPKWRGP